jgi:hypothetical protein
MANPVPTTPKEKEIVVSDVPAELTEKIKLELQSIGSSCLMDFSQAARFVVRNSQTQDTLLKAARNFSTTEEAINSAQQGLFQLSKRMQDVLGQSDRISHSFGGLALTLESIKNTNSLVKQPQSQQQPV